MKKLISLVLVSSICSICFSQDFSKWNDYKFSSPADYKDKEPQIKECAMYILSTPYDKKDINRLIASKFILDWMGGTPDYVFSFGDGYKYIANGKKELEISELYVSATVVYVLDNPANAKDNKAADKAAVLKVIDYVANEANKLEPNKRLKKLIEAKKNNTLEQEMHF